MKNTSLKGLALALLLLAAPFVGASDRDADTGESGGAPAAEAPDLDWPVVRFVEATEAADGTWRFDVTVEHNDEGWDHYADAWQVLNPETTEIIAERFLLHPHDNEQPFTRSQSAISIPEDLSTVIVRARCTVHGFGEVNVLVDLDAEDGEGFTVRRAGS